jgi:hypothetical protein
MVNGMGGVFISYRSDDEPDSAAFLAEFLSELLGADAVFFASRSIHLGADFTNTIVDWLRRRCSVLLAVMGPGWLESRGPQGRRRLDQEEDWVRREVAEALNLGVTVIPILLRETSLPKGDDLPAEIAPIALRQYWRLRHRTMHDDLAGLINRLAEIDPNLLAPEQVAELRPLDQPVIAPWVQGLSGMLWKIAAVAHSLYPPEGPAHFMSLHPSGGADLLNHMSPVRAANILSIMPPPKAARVLAGMERHRIAAVLSIMSPPVRRAVVAAIAAILDQRRSADRR